ncbi:MAG: hypothetical protein MUC87_16530 [Bacteroidia bacterium]|jgi:hypothetical protein|nr:hypothetical protein [Bacteroidia bacterium]
MALKYFPLLLLLLAACDNPKRNPTQQPVDTAGQTTVNSTAADTPSTKANPFAIDTSQRNQKAVADVLNGLPDLMEGDIIVQDIQNINGNIMRDAMQSEWSNIGIIFRREADGAMVVMDATGKVRLTPLPEWISAGRGNKVALYRLKDGENILVPKTTKQLRAACKPFKNKPADLYFGWADDELYSAELVWKVYSTGLNISLCPTRTLKDLKLDGEALKPLIAKKYGKNIPLTETAVTIPDIVQSKQLKQIYAR